MDTNNFVPQMGMDVIGSDGEKVGEIDAVEQDYFVVRKGFFFPQDHYIPFSAVDSFEERAVYLNVTKDGALEQQWTEAPAYTTDDSILGSTGTTQTDAGYVDTDVNAGYGETRVDDRTWSDADLNRDTIEVREEDLNVGTREVDRGSVRVDKHVVEEQRSVDVPVTEEEIHVTRRSVDREASGLEFEESTFEVPLRGEEVDVSKTARVVEEIDIDKTARERTEHVTDTVRREEVEISGDGINIEDDGFTSTNRDERGLLDKAKDALTDDDKDRGVY